MKNVLTRPRVTFLAVCAVLACGVTALVPGPLHRLIRESSLSKVTSPHYRVLFDRTAVSEEAARDFAAQREPMFTALNRRLGGGAEGGQINVVLNPSTRFPDSASVQRGYFVENSTIRVKTTVTTAAGGAAPPLDPAADAEALLYATWGKPGSPEMGYWTAIWLLGEQHGEELGMAAAQLEQRVGFKNVAALLGPAGNPHPGTLNPQDRALLAAAWLNEVAEFGGVEQVHKLYSARSSKMSVATATTALGTTTSELERKWQLWLYSYVAGMPPGGTHVTSMPGMPGMPLPSPAASHS